jgi:N-acetylglucosamine-6-phosphate deacetylase
MTDKSTECTNFFETFLINEPPYENKCGTNQKEYIASVKDSTLEDWYDKAYNTMLMVIIANDQLEISRELKNLKGKYKW